MPIAGDFALVTRNAVDFRGSPEAPGNRGLYRNQALHAGLVCLNGPPGMDLDMQREWFETAFDKLDALGNDLTNRVLEVTLENGESDLVVRVYDLPSA